MHCLLQCNFPLISLRKKGYQTKNSIAPGARPPLLKFLDPSLVDSFNLHQNQETAALSQPVDLLECFRAVLFSLTTFL